MKNQKFSVITLTVVAFSLMSTAHAVTPRSTAYTMEYAVVGMGGGMSSSDSYDLTAYADESGSAAKASSASYSIEPVVGASTVEPNAAVDTWALY